MVAGRGGEMIVEVEAKTGPRKTCAVPVGDSDSSNRLGLPALPCRAIVCVRPLRDSHLG